MAKCPNIMLIGLKFNCAMGNGMTYQACIQYELTEDIRWDKENLLTCISHHSVQSENDYVSLQVYQAKI